MLKLTTFGGLSLSRDGQPLAGAAAQRSRLALLALLASAGPAGISRDKLLLFLWPESDSERARHALKQAVYALRRDLGDDEAIQGTNALTLNPTLFESDVREFEAAIARGDYDAATALYTGPFLDGVYLKDAPEFERWCADQRTRLSQSWSRAVEQLAKRAEAAGDWEDAVTRWRQLAAAEPLSGRIACSLMRALAESGDVAAALQYYRVHEMMVREDMDATPDKDVATLADALKAGTWVRSAPRVSAPQEQAAARDSGGARASGGVEAVPRAESPIARPDSFPSGSAPAVAPPVHRPPARRRIAVVAAILVSTLAVLAATSYWMTHRPPAVDEKVVLIAPLENNTNDPALRTVGLYFSDWLGGALRDLGFRVKDTRTAALSARRVEETTCAPQQLQDRLCAVEIAEQTGAQQVIVGAYYLMNDTLRITIQITDVVDKELTSSFTLSAPRSGMTDLVARIGKRVAADLVGKSDRSPWANTVKLVPPPSVEAHAHATRAWELFFLNPADTTAVFNELTRALAPDSSYALPWIFKAYIYDVKKHWAGLEEIVVRLRPRAPTLGVEARTALEMFEADLTGRSYDRLRVSRTLKEKIPGSTEFVLLVVLSSLYVGRPADAVAAISETTPDSGMNQLSSVYWQWRSVAQHANGEYPAEAKSVEQGRIRFPQAPTLVDAQLRVLAQRGDTLGIDSLLQSDVPGTRDAISRQSLALFAARELRAHDHAREAKAILDRLAAAVKDVALTAPAPELRRKGEIAHEAGDYTTSGAVFAELWRRDPLDVHARGRQGAAAARRGDAALAAQIDGELAALKTRFLLGQNTLWRAHIAAAGGRHEDAANLLSQAVDEGYRLIDIIPHTPHDDGDFAELRGSPSYERLMKRLADRIP